MRICHYSYCFHKDDDYTNNNNNQRVAVGAHVTRPPPAPGSRVRGDGSGLRVPVTSHTFARKPQGEEVRARLAHRRCTAGPRCSFEPFTPSSRSLAVVRVLPQEQSHGGAGTGELSGRGPRPGPSPHPSQRPTRAAGALLSGPWFPICRVGRGHLHPRVPVTTT